MSFSETYRHEVLQSRRDRSRRAFFWAKVTSLILVLTIGLTLRADPVLRSTLAEAGMSTIARIANLDDTQTHVALPPSVDQQPLAPAGLPRSRIPVNRPVSADAGHQDAAAQGLN